MTSQDIDDRQDEARREHPPLRLRSRRSILLPDLRPPTLEELRWRSSHRAERRDEAGRARTRRKAAPAPTVERAIEGTVDETVAQPSPPVAFAPAPPPPALEQLVAAPDWQPDAVPPFDQHGVVDYPVAVARAALIATEPAPEWEAEAEPEWEPEAEPEPAGWSPLGR